MRGQVLLAVAIAMPVLIGIVGLGIDIGRIYVAHMRLQAAVDAAALAGTTGLPDDPDLSKGIVSRRATEYLSRNYPEAQMSSLQPGSAVRTICINAQVNVPMTFMVILGVDSRSLTASACAGFNDLEVVFVIDNSGSMEGTPINQVKNAAKKLLDLMMPGNTSGGVKVGLVPFRGKVRVANWDDGLAPGCRNADGTVNNSNVPYKGYPDRSCTDNALPPIFGLSNSKTAIKAAINSMQAAGGYSYTSGTIIAEGIKWGHEVLSPDPPFDQGGNRDRFRKVLILLSDGDNEDGTCGGDNATCDPTSDPNCIYRRNAYFQMNPPVTDCSCGPNWTGCLDAAMRQAADLAKEDGIEIFAIQYCGGKSCTDYTDQQLMKYVASSTPGTDDHYFHAPSNSEIHKIFDKIGQQLGLRLTK